MDDSNRYREPIEYRERMDRLRVLTMMQGIGNARYTSLLAKNPWMFCGGLEENFHRTRMFITFEELETYVLEMDIGVPT